MTGQRGCQPVFPLTHNEGSAKIQQLQGLRDYGGLSAIVMIKTRNDELSYICAGFGPLVMYSRESRGDHQGPKAKVQDCVMLP